MIENPYRVCDVCKALAHLGALPAGWVTATINIRDHLGHETQYVLDLCDGHRTDIGIIAGPPAPSFFLDVREEVTTQPPRTTPPSPRRALLPVDVREVICEHGPIARPDIARNLGVPAEDRALGRALRTLIKVRRIREDRASGRSTQYVAIGPDIDSAGTRSAIAFIRENPGKTIRQIAASIGSTTRDVSRWVDTLVYIGEVEPTGGDNAPDVEIYPTVRR